MSRPSSPSSSPSLASPSLAFTSGDVIADRRREHARQYFSAGEAAAAAELMEQALEIAPAWAAGWFELAEFREAAGDRDGAIAAHERVLALDPDDRCGAVLRLSRLGARAAPDAPPAAHVRDLFDGYAARFERSLVDGLGYRMPEHLAGMLDRLAPGRRFAHGLDLGCGTGLMAVALGGRVDRLDGVDLSAGMVAEARAKGLYDSLRVGELVSDLAGLPDAAFDLVLAADVFCYLGELGPALGGVARVTAPGGIVAFSVEALTAAEADGAGHRLRDSLRWGHDPAAVEATAGAVGLTPLAIERTVGRRDRGVDVEAAAMVFTKA